MDTTPSNGLRHCPDPGPVALPIARGHDQLTGVGADRFGVRVPEQLLRAGIPVRHASLAVDAQKRVVRDFDERTRRMGFVSLHGRGC